MPAVQLDHRCHEAASAVGVHHALAAACAIAVVVTVVAAPMMRGHLW
jgi:hypothetical protein